MSTSAAFSGSIPTAYDAHLGPYLFEPYAADLAARLPAGDDVQVLEIACGTGIVTKRLRDVLPASATLVATDLNQAMIDYAQTSVAAPGIDWAQADAQALPYEDESFDVVVCQFGFMFLPDKVQGFREARRVLRPGGVLLANVWHARETMPAIAAIGASLATQFPEDTPRFLDTPYGYSDKDRIHGDLTAAGFEDVELDDVRVDGVSASAEDVAAGFARGSPLTHELGERGADLDAVVGTLTEALIPVGGDRPFRAPLVATVITARC